MRRVAFSMTVDPDGAMHDWVDVPAGWELTRVPTQEAVSLVGARAYVEALCDLVERERVHLVVTHPPYDYLDEDAGARLRAAGARVVGYAFDDDIFAGAYGDDTRAALARTYDRYATTHDVPWATRPLPALAPQAPEHDVALVGRAYERRRALVDALRAAGLRVAVRGAGWPEGPVARSAMLELYARAAVVLTTADWENRPVAMVKHRLLDTAVLGAFQVAQEAPDLRRYFPPDEVPSWSDAGELVAQVRAALADPERRRAAATAARARALAEHTWTRRFPELVGPLDLREPDEQGPRSRLFDQLLVALASRAEAEGRIGAAAALWGQAHARDAADATAAGGLGRCLRDLGDLEAALPPLRAAAAAPAPPCAAALHIAIPPSGRGTGLGRLSLFPPQLEPLALWIASLVELGRLHEALAVVDEVRDPVLRRALAATLGGDVPEALRARLS